MTASSIPDSTDHLIAAINEALKLRSEKDWNYSRIALIKSPLHLLTSPYVLQIESVDSRTKDFKEYSREITWGTRHSSELGILEIVSLRINLALLECTSDDYWNHRRPVVRIVKKEEIREQGLTDAIWYEITEVAGEEFDNR